jgi:hypothetical protein
MPKPSLAVTAVATPSSSVADAQADKAALILQAIVQATDAADQDCGNVQASSNWLLLIQASATYAHCLLTGQLLPFPSGGEKEVSHG